MSALPALPDPSGLDLAAVANLGALLVVWAEETTDVAAVRDAAARWSAITEYVRRTSREGVAEAEAALRRLEVRIGRLMPPVAETNGRPLDRDLKAMSHDERHDLRALAEHADVVEEVIAASDDASPPSRRKCLTEIARRRDAADVAAAVAEAESLAPRIHAALAELPVESPRLWVAVIRLVAVDEDDARSLIPDEVEILQLGEEAAA